MRALVVTSIFLSGCNAILGIGDVHTSAGNVDAPLPTVGTAEMANEDLTKYTIDVLVVDDSQPSGFRTIHATGTKDGTITVADVPDGATFLLELQSSSLPFPQYYVATRHDLDLGFVTVGRPDGVPTMNTSPIGMTLSDMTAWSTGDELWADSFGNGSEVQIDKTTTFTNQPAKGATSLNASTFDWKAGYVYDPAGGTPRLLDASKGDDLSIAHTTKFNVVDSGGSGFVTQATRLVDLYTSTGVMQQDGVQSDLNGAFTHATIDQTQNAFIDLPSLRTAFGDAGHFYLETLTLYRVTAKAVPYGVPIGPGIVSLQLPSIPGFIDQLHFNNVMYGDPYPSDWPDLIQHQIVHYRFLKASGATSVGAASYGNSANLNATTNYGAEPYTHPPAHVRIGALDLIDGGAVPFDGMKPVTMTWDAVPSASSYQVRVFHAYNDLGNTLYTETGRVVTDQTSVLIPAALMTKGEEYVFLVITVRDPTNYGQGHLRRSGFPNGSGAIITGIVRMSDLCGNGNVDSGEECDGMGETAACDSDCTMAACGDGHVNPLANEQCDTVVNARECNTNCKAPMCGDGVWNSNIEQCDDGNLTDGDGCSSGCVLESCGDGVRKTPWESCDDGNATSGDGCTSYCRVEPGYICVGAPSVCTKT